MNRVNRFFRNQRVTFILTVKFVRSFRAFLREAKPSKGDKILANGEFLLLRADELAELEEALLDLSYDEVKSLYD